MTLEDGALIEPLAVAVHSVSNLAQFQSGQNIIVFGAGPVGLLAMAVAKAIGANRIVAVDINKERLEFAKKYAATDVYQTPAPKEGEARPVFTRRVAREIQAELGLTPRGSTGIDLVLEASGAEPCIQIGLYILKPGGKYVQVGMGTSMINIPMDQVMTKSLTIFGSFRYGPKDYENAISFVGRGLIDLKPLVTHRFKFEEAVKAFGITQRGKDDEGKGTIKCLINGPE